VIDNRATRHGRPAPQLHVDAAGRAPCFLAEYDTARDPRDLAPQVLPVVERVRAHTHGLRLADSVTVDFHKTGRGHDPAGAFTVNRRGDLKCLARDVGETPYFSEADARRDPARFTLECSRPAIGPCRAQSSGKRLGAKWVQDWPRQTRVGRMPPQPSGGRVGFAGSELRRERRVGETRPHPRLGSFES
jgi:glutamate/tyrosine decarboxylase-like PLP-dependent enzyme